MNEPETATEPTPDVSQYDNDTQAAIEQCRAYLVSKNVDPPTVFVIEACDELIVAGPPLVEASDRLTRMAVAKNLDPIRFVETFCAEVVYWVRGMTGTPGSAGAMKHLKELRKRWTKGQIFDAITGQIQEQMDQIRGSASVKKL